MRLLCVQFKKATHAKTAEGVVGVVMEDALPSGSIMHTPCRFELKLILADGSLSPSIKVDTLSECSEAEVAHYEAEVAEFDELLALEAQMSVL
jgi:hypothetical protein